MSRRFPTEESLYFFRTYLFFSNIGSCISPLQKSSDASCRLKITIQLSDASCKLHYSLASAGSNREWLNFCFACWAHTRRA